MQDTLLYRNWLICFVIARKILRSLNIRLFVVAQFLHRSAWLSTGLFIAADSIMLKMDSLRRLSDSDISG
ncbi:MAG: hypothetical protein BGO12_08395 [Verrucomicrobia bacterium 61-8]|nr:MAG: hypothetical protein BGO12_08395 [Verrucomicrobia bacterium 61-8]